MTTDKDAIHRPPSIPNRIRVFDVAAEVAPVMPTPNVLIRLPVYVDVLCDLLAAVERADPDALVEVMPPANSADGPLYLGVSWTDDDGEAAD